MLLSDRVWKCSTRTRPQQGKHPLAVSSRHGSALISHHWTCNEKQQDVQEEKTITGLASKNSRMCRRKRLSCREARAG